MHGRLLGTTTFASPDLTSAPLWVCSRCTIRDLADAGECLERGTKRKATALLDTQALDTHDTQTHTACTCDSSGSQEPCAAQMRSSLEAHHHHIQASDLHSYPHPPRSQTPADDANSEETAPEVDHESELRPREQPIDHIFQFHRALRRELEKLERQSQELLDLHNGASGRRLRPTGAGERSGCGFAPVYRAVGNLLA